MKANTLKKIEAGFGCCFAVIAAIGFRYCLFAPEQIRQVMHMIAG